MLPEIALKCTCLYSVCVCLCVYRVCMRIGLWMCEISNVTKEPTKGHSDKCNSVFAFFTVRNNGQYTISGLNWTVLEYSYLLERR